ncbi:MAG TPA: ATP-binding protein [Kofleriaceae bacterium]|nr:ATP-binding protein [Kofleriaceae bacterium]
MSLGVRAKLFAVSIGLILAVVLASGFYLEGQLRGLLERRMEAELLDIARAAQVLVEAVGADSIHELDPLAERLGSETGTRITVISPDGDLLGDTDLRSSEVAAAESHARRPEVLGALAQGRGSSRRYSTTVSADLLYIAVPYRDGDRQGVVRVARPLREVDQAVARLRLLIAAAGAIGLLVAVIMSGLASHFMSRTLRRLAESARAIAEGDTGSRLAVSGRDELAGLAGSLNQMAEDVERTVSELATERALFSAVLEGLSDAVIAIDALGDVTLMNAAAQTLLGLLEPPIGSPLLETVRAPGLQDLLDDETATAEIDLFTGRRVLIRQSALHDGRGRVLLMQDVTEVRRLERVRSDFVANVSHELRTPISVIRANSETLLDGAMDDPVHGKKLLEAAHRNAERLSAIISDLLDLSRLESGAHRIEPREIDLAPVVARVLEATEGRARDHGTELSVELPTALGARADDEALEHILLNYVENAIKYTPDGGHVRITGRAIGSRVRIEVIDDGPGIAPRHRDRVFERFYRIDPGRSRDMGGTGLGLSIVKHLAEAMGGRVGVATAAPHGSIFWVELAAA